MWDWMDKPVYNRVDAPARPPLKARLRRPRAADATESFQYFVTVPKCWEQTSPRTGVPDTRPPRLRLTFSTINLRLS
jgi:hypothetical protein